MYLHLFIRDNHYSYQGPSAERILALAEAEEDLSGFRFTFRPVDGTVYQQGSHVPCGVLFRERYLESARCSEVPEIPPSPAELLARDEATARDQYGPESNHPGDIR